MASFFPLKPVVCPCCQPLRGAWVVQRCVGDPEVEGKWSRGRGKWSRGRGKLVLKSGKMVLRSRKSGREVVVVARAAKLETSEIRNKTTQIRNTNPHGRKRFGALLVPIPGISARTASCRAMDGGQQTTVAIERDFARFHSPGCVLTTFGAFGRSNVTWRV